MSERLRTKQELDAEVAGQTVASVFAETVGRDPDHTALRERQGDGWAELTWADYADRACRISAGLIDLGVQPGDRVVLMMRNRTDFHLVDVAALLAGATPISIYNSSAPDQVAYLAGHSKATMAVVDDATFLERFTNVRSELPSLRQLVSIEQLDGAVPLGDLLAHEPITLEDGVARCTPEQLATVIYTSGTTGPPKGVQLSHYNVTWTMQSYMDLLGGREAFAGHRAVSYLPMAHIAERLHCHYLGMGAPFEVTSCPEMNQVAAYAREVHPQSMFGVPRVWEKMHAGVAAALAGDPQKHAQFNDALAAALPLQLARRTRQLTADEQQTLDFLDEVAFKGIRELLGLDAVEHAVSGAAPMPVEILEWFVGIGVPFSEIYGMSENTGPLTWDPWEIRPGTVGRAMPGVEIRLGDDGEVLARGGNIFPGYLDDPEKTADALDGDGWLHTGDIGQLDSEGYLKIVDRKKELIITAGGKNISPANLEQALKTIPLIGQACAIGDRRPFVAALLVLDPDVARAWAANHGKPDATLAELAADPELVDEVERGVKEVMADFNNAEQVKKVTILPDEWLPDTEELTPTSKLKRRGVHAKYAAEIEALYS